MNRLLQGNTNKRRTFPPANSLTPSLHALNQSSDFLGLNKRGRYYSGNIQLDSLMEPPNEQINWQHPSTSQNVVHHREAAVLTSNQNFNAAFDDLQDFDHPAQKVRRTSQQEAAIDSGRQRISLKKKIETLGIGLGEYIEGVLQNENSEPNNGQIMMAIYHVGNEFKQMRAVLSEMVDQMTPIPEMMDVLKKKSAKGGSKQASDLNKGWNANFESQFLINLDGKNAKISEKIKTRADLENIVRYHQNKYIWPEPKCKGIGLKNEIQEYLAPMFIKIDKPTELAYHVAQFLWNRDHMLGHFITAFIQNGEPNRGHQEKRQIIPLEEKTLFGKIMLYCGGYLIADHHNIRNEKQAKSNWYQWINQGREMLNLRGIQAKQSGKHLVPTMVPGFIPIFDRPEFMPHPQSPNLNQLAQQHHSADQMQEKGRDDDVIPSSNGSEQGLEEADGRDEVYGPEQNAFFEEDERSVRSDRQNMDEEEQSIRDRSAQKITEEQIAPPNQPLPQKITEEQIAPSNQPLQQRNSSGRNLRTTIKPPAKLQL